MIRLTDPINVVSAEIPIKNAVLEISVQAARKANDTSGVVSTG